MSERSTVGGGLDAHGNPITADRDTVARYDAAIDQLLRFDPAVIDTAAALTGGDDTPAPMGLALGAYLLLSSTDPHGLDQARALHASLADTAGNERERLHAAAIGTWLDGSWTGAAAVLDEVLVRWPTDLVAVIMGHQLDFFVGDAHSLRDRPLRTLGELDPDHPHAGYVRGMAAFGLEEAGHYERALDAGLAAVAANEDDVWAIHAVAHTHEMVGSVADGIRFMTVDHTSWGARNLFTVHLWWHLALYHLEAGRTDEVLAVYDAEIRHPGSVDAPFPMLDAASLLWRLHLDGVDVGDRFAVIADAWRTQLDAGGWFPFNDVHAVMAHVGAGRLADARAVVDRMTVAAAVSSSAVAVADAAITAEVGLPVGRAVLAHGEARYGHAVAELLPIRRQVHRIGGSHAQRDVVQRTLVDAALRDGQLDLARALIAERLALRDTSVYAWAQRARLLAARRDPDGAAEAAATAERHRRALAADGRGRA
ncbi:MAG: tetratricopeptide repeat protein [Actinomycetota bacterium]|nr:tetratricopeptide repeat protein [Actinomycetota bacterium]